jgi:hypothetical protein
MREQFLYLSTCASIVINRNLINFTAQKAESMTPPNTMA